MSSKVAAPLDSEEQVLTDELNLAAEFAPATNKAWLKLVDKVLGGADFEKVLVGRTYDGLTIQPLYTSEDWSCVGDPSGFPGAAPLTRGGHALGTVRGWDSRQCIGHPDHATTNAQILEDLEGGVSSILLNTNATDGGARIETAAEMSRVLDGVLLDLAPVSLSAGGVEMSALLMHAVQQRNAQEKFAGSFSLDLLGELARTGTAAIDFDMMLARHADVSAYVARKFPQARTFGVRGDVYHSAGSSAVQELGCVLGAALEYLRAMTAAGIDVDTASKQIGFTIAVDADFFISIAKVRALRKAWARVIEVCGAKVQSTHITAVTAARMMTRRDPWVNVLRTTVACFAAGIAGADAITVLPFDSRLGLPSNLGRRIARNTHVILQEESGLSKVIDPAGGAWLFESLTEKLTENAWSFLQDIERRGGMSEALKSGFIASQIGTVQAQRAQNIACRKDPLTGVSEFPDLNEAPLKSEQPPRVERRAVPNFNVGPLPAPGTGEFTEALIDAVRSGANIAALTQALASDRGISIQSLPAIHLSDDFERLRDASDAYKAKRGHFPRIYVASVGSVAEFTERATYAKNLFEAGGIEAVSGTGGYDAEAIAVEFISSGARLAVLCSGDKIGSDTVVEIAKALKARGAEHMYFVGSGADLEVSLRNAGVDEFLFVGCDVLAVLNRAHQLLAVA